MSSVKAKQITEWDKAIEDAKKHIKRLESVVKVFGEKKAAGEQWPARQQKAS